MKNVLVLGGGGFIGHHLVRWLDAQQIYRVTAVDWQLPQFSTTEASTFRLGDLRNPQFVDDVIGGKVYDRIYQLAADMGGAGYIFTGDHDCDIMSNSAKINLNVIDSVRKYNKNAKVFYSSSACIYPSHNQTDPTNPICTESSAYPANPDSEYGWEKLFSERLYLAAHRNDCIDIRIARFHNIYGPEGTFEGGKEKAPAAICRKVITSSGSIEIWGDGTQTRSFLPITDCLEGIEALMSSSYRQPVNIGSEEMVTINRLVTLAEQVEGKKLQRIYNPTAPIGVMGRCSDNSIAARELHWTPRIPLKNGIDSTYRWIKKQIDEAS